MAEYSTSSTLNQHLCNDTGFCFIVLLGWRNRIHYRHQSEDNRNCLEILNLRTARMASSNTVFNPFWVKAEHSRYLTAFISLDIATPWEYWIGAMRLKRRQSQGEVNNFLVSTHRSRNFSIVAWSSRKSSLVPTNTIEVCGAWWEISGYHWKTEAWAKINGTWGRAYFGADIFIAWRANEGKADQEDIGLWVGKGAESIIILLSGSIPQTKWNCLAIDHDVSRVIVKN